MNERFQLWPEQSTSALVCHHPSANYFTLQPRGQEPVLQSVTLEIVLAVDWSGARSGVRRALWVAEARAGRLSRLECGRDREETITHILELASSEPRLVVGLDFAFSFPAWFLRERGISSASEAWEIADRDGESWLARCEPPFWGRPGRPRPPTDPARPPFRFTEGERLPIRGIGPKSVFQIGGAGAVGTGSIRGMPKLLELSAAGFSIWPFDPPRLPLVLEIYPRWLTGRVAKASEISRRLFLATHADGEEREIVETAASNEHALDAAASALAMTRLADLPRDHDPLHLLEGRIWNPIGELHRLRGREIVSTAPCRARVEIASSDEKDQEDGDEEARRAGRQVAGSHRESEEADRHDGAR